MPEKTNKTEPQEQPNSSPVCYADSPEIRPEYRLEHTSESNALPVKPLKRHSALQPLSRQHHHGLLLCWKIRAGLSKGIALERIKRYADWFYEQHLLPHFHTEEQHIFPILGEAHELTLRAVSEHRRLTRLFKKETDLEKTLHLIEEELQQHIRFEERVLFTEIQKFASDANLKKAESLHHETIFQDNLEDEFWAHQK